jgi:contractile injection system tube protein
MMRPPRHEDGLWTPPGDKFTIATIDGKAMDIAAQYNPNEMAFQSAATWNENASSHGGPKASSKWLEYGSSAARTLTVELLFDGYEEGLPVEGWVAKLESLTQPVDLKTTRAALRRPQLCVAVWGQAKQFRCVVQSVATKLTKFLADGRPVRAVCTVTLKEVDVATMLEHDGELADASAAAARALRRSTLWRRLDDLE